MEEIVLVNELDEKTGTCEKLQAHKEGLLHRAFSIFILNSKNEYLLQKRAAHKYHSPNLWSNACCSHDIIGVAFEAYINQRLQDEIGINAPLQKVFDTIYNLDCGNNLIEHEFNHVFVGKSDLKPILNPDEVSEVRYVNSEQLNMEIESNPNGFTPWFKFLFPMVDQHLIKLAD